jgi:hypothetical protein
MCHRALSIVEHRAGSDRRLVPKDLLDHLANGLLLLHSPFSFPLPPMPGGHPYPWYGGTLFCVRHISLLMLLFGCCIVQACG